MASLTRQSAGACGSAAAMPGPSAAMTAWGASARSTNTSLGHGPTAAGGTTTGGALATGATQEPSEDSAAAAISGCVTSPAHTSVARSGLQPSAYARLTSPRVITFALEGVP